MPKSVSNAARSGKAQNKLHVVKGDRVKVITGKDKGLVGEVIAVYPGRSKVTVAGVNIVKRHLRDTSAQPQSRSTTKGGIVASEETIPPLVVCRDCGWAEVSFRCLFTMFTPATVTLLRSG